MHRLVLWHEKSNFDIRQIPQCYVHTQISVVLLGPDIGILTFRHSFQRLSPGVIYGKKEEKRKRKMKFYKKSHVSITRHRKYMTR